jgi:hypothetical protein
VFCIPLYDIHWYSLHGDVQWEFTSAGLNLAIIGLYGVIFEALADALAEWENHRLESEFENSRVRLSCKG